MSTEYDNSYISDCLIHWTGREGDEKGAYVLNLISSTLRLLLSYNTLHIFDFAHRVDEKMTCFTDVPLRHSHEHCKRYGRYLAVVLDLFSRKVVGWSLDTHMREPLVLEALDMAVSRRGPVRNTVLHSDRGVQYRGHDYQLALREYGFRCSMSRTGNCWDNAVMEAFFSRLKVDLIHPEAYRSMAEARCGIFEYIESFYNRTRRHSALGYLSPHQYEQQHQLAVSTIRG